jgi:hypothetical protein
MTINDAQQMTWISPPTLKTSYPLTLLLYDTVSDAEPSASFDMASCCFL